MVVAAGLVFSVVSCKAPPQRTKTTAKGPLSEGAFKAEISVKKVPKFISEDYITELEVEVTNISNSTWPAGLTDDGLYGIYLSYHLLSKGGVFIMEGERTPLPYDIGPGDKAIIRATVLGLTTLKKGRGKVDYVIEFDLLQEGVGWFGVKGSKKSRIAIQVALD